MKQFLILTAFVCIILSLFKPPIEELKFVIPRLRFDRYVVDTPLNSFEVPYTLLCELTYPALSMTGVIRIHGRIDSVAPFSKLAVTVIPSGDMEQRGYCYLLLDRGRGAKIDASNNMYEVAQYDLTQEVATEDTGLDLELPWTNYVKDNEGLIHRIYKVYGSKPLSSVNELNGKSTLFKVRANNGEIRYLYGYGFDGDTVYVLDPLYPDNRGYTVDLSTMTYHFRLRTFHVKEMYQ